MPGAARRDRKPECAARNGLPVHTRTHKHTNTHTHTRNPLPPPPPTHTRAHTYTDAKGGVKKDLVFKQKRPDIQVKES